jgi:hypothetical protein
MLCEYPAAHGASGFSSDTLQDDNGEGVGSPSCSDDDLGVAEDYDTDHQEDELDSEQVSM